MIKIKVLLLILVIGFGFYNYKIINFNDGVQFVSLDQSTLDDSSFIEQLKYLTDIESVYYYDNPLGKDKVIIIESPEGIRMSVTEQETINELDITSVLFKNLTPQKATPIPLFVYGIIIAIIIFYNPRKGKK